MGESTPNCWPKLSAPSMRFWMLLLDALEKAHAQDLPSMARTFTRVLRGKSQPQCDFSVFARRLPSPPQALTAQGRIPLYRQDRVRPWSRSMEREEAKKRLKALGAKRDGSVSKKPAVWWPARRRLEAEKAQEPGVTVSVRRRLFETAQAIKRGQSSRHHAPSPRGSVQKSIFVIVLIAVPLASYARVRSTYRGCYSSDWSSRYARGSSPHPIVPLHR